MPCCQRLWQLGPDPDAGQQPASEGRRHQDHRQVDPYSVIRYQRIQSKSRSIDRLFYCPRGGLLDDADQVHEDREPLKKSDIAADVR